MKTKFVFILMLASVRSNPTFKNAVEEMTANSATVRTTNVALPTLPEQVGKVELVVDSDRRGRSQRTRLPSRRR